MSQAVSPSNATALNATTGIAAVRAPFARDPGSFETVHIRQSEVHQDDVRKMLGAERDGLCAPPGNQRPESRGEQHVLGELQVPSVVVDDQDEPGLRAPLVSRRTGHRRILYP